MKNFISCQGEGGNGDLTLIDAEHQHSQVKRIWIWVPNEKDDRDIKTCKKIEEDIDIE